MRNPNVLFIGVCFIAGCLFLSSCHSDSTFIPVPAGGYQLIWADEFDGNSLNTDFWIYEIDGCGEGNNELEFYRIENTEVADGYLYIRPEPIKKEDEPKYNKRCTVEPTYGRPCPEYTSSRLLTKDKFAFQYGYVELRVKLPNFAGMWPAFWLMPQANQKLLWPTGGEIDIAEVVGQRPKEVYSTLHYGAATTQGGYVADSGAIGGSFAPIGGDFSEDFHTFAFEWTPDAIRYYFQGEQYFEAAYYDMNIPETTVHLNDQEITIKEFVSQNYPEASVTQGYPFDNSFYIILNLAVGGNWPNTPDPAQRQEDKAKDFPKELIVDYIRVYQQDGSPAPLLQPSPDPIESETCIP